jgi:nucleolar pre-ribosomal-associated protein 1
MRQILDLLQNVMVENSILFHSRSSFNALLVSLKDTQSDTLPICLEFLDNCLCRIAKKPVHYRDLAVSLTEGRSEKLSSLVAAVKEQWPFVIKANDALKEKTLASWAALLLRQLKQAGEDGKALKAARDHLMELSEEKKTRSILRKALRGSDGTDSDDEDMIDPSSQAPPPTASKLSTDLLDMFGALPTESKNHTALYKWEGEELELAVEQGRVKDLMLCLCSEHEEIRRQAFAAITRLMAKLKVRLIPISGIGKR